MLRNIIVLLVLSINICHAQYKNSVWCFGDSARIDFVNGTATAGGSIVASRGSCVSIADSIGLLFYGFTNPGTGFYSAKIINRNNVLMDGGDSIVGNSWYNELMIIPNPAGNNRFYIFHLTASLGLGGGHNGLFYSVVDLNYNSGLGKVTTKNQHLITTDYLTDAMGAVKHGNGRDWWVVCKPIYSGATGPIPSDTFYVYLVTPDSIHEPMKQRIGTDRGWGLGNFTFSNAGNKLSVVMSDGIIEVFDFDRCSGILSNANIIYDIPMFSDGNNAFSGSAFSPNDSLLYVTQGVYLPPYYILQIDLSNNDIDTVAQVTSFSSSFTRGTGALRLAPDGKIYIATIARDSFGGIWFPYPNNFYSPDNMYLASIDSPNVKGTGCSYNPYSIYLGSKRCYFGLPNNPDYELGALQGSGCDTLTALKQDPEIVKNNLFVYPNPAKDFVFIKCTGSITYEITDVAGKQYKQGNSDLEGNAVVSINIEELMQGVYIVKATQENCTKVAQIVVIK